MVCVPAAEQLDRLWDEIREASPDAAPSEFPPGAECPAGSGSPAVPAVPLRDELRRLKFVFATAEAQRHFVECAARESCFAADPPSAVGSRGVEVRRGDAKERNKDLKRFIAHEEELHGGLQRDIRDTYRRAKHLQDKCLRELQEAALKESTLDPMHLVDMGFCGEPGAPRHHRDTEDDASRSADDLRRLWVEREDKVATRQRLEAELCRVAGQRKVQMELTDRLLREEAQDDALAGNMLAVQEAEARLGMPHIELDVPQGLATLGVMAAPGSCAGRRTALGESASSIKASFAEDGRLRGCAPDPALHLQQEAAAAVRDDDLARLLTLAWDRICEAGTGTSGSNEGYSQPGWPLPVRSGGA